MPVFGAVRAVKHLSATDGPLPKLRFAIRLTSPELLGMGALGLACADDPGALIAFRPDQGAFMSDYDKEKWVKLYRTAALELEHAKMAGRIRDTRIEIAARIEKLHDVPGLHAQEKQAIEDALSGLKVLEREEARHEADERRIAESALEKLRTLAPRIENL